MIRQSFAVSVVLVLSNTVRKTLQLLMLCAITLALVPSARADVSAPQPSPKSDVNESSGAFSEVIPIQVPAFHGLEPKLALVYTSAAGDGFVGVGWTLTGQSFIERASPGGGTPKYDASDIFLFDGEELLACTTFDGTHCPKYQSYQRIKYNAAANSGKGQWLVWDKDGTKSTYNPLYASGTDTFRWALGSRVDTHNNTVTYTYKCVGTGCYPETITYNNASITFYTATRPEVAVNGGGIAGFNFASGRSLISNTQRLISIVVRVGTSAVRGYKLDYASDSIRPLLTSVQECGTDLTVGATGTTSAGVLTCPTSLPAITMTYQPLTPSFSTSWLGFSAGDNPSSSYCQWDSVDYLRYESFCYDPVQNLCIQGDFTGDGMGDIACLMNHSGNWAVYRSNGSGWVNTIGTGTWTGPTPATLPVPDRCISGDFNADGKTDISCYTSGGVWQTALTNSTGTGFNMSNWAGPGPGIPISNQCVSGDFNNDGKTDITCYTGSNGSWHTVLSNGSNFTGGGYWSGPAPAIPVTNQCVPGDFNGDGKTDLSCQTGSNTGQWATHLSTGTNFASAGNWSGARAALPVSNQCMTGDFNGDGKADLICYPGSGFTWQASLSFGANFLNIDLAGGPAPTLPIGGQCTSGDFNGDGRTDLACTDSASEWATYLSSGNAFATSEVWGGAEYSGECLVADFNGDGRVDMACQPEWGAGWSMGLSDGGQADLLTTVTNGVGGVTEIAYVPSSHWATADWPAIYLPVGTISQTVASVTVKDGRDLVDVTNYSYYQANWSDVLHRPLGFKVTQTRPSDGSYINTTHRQTDASPGVVSQIDTYSSAVKLQHSVVKTFSESAAGVLPYTSLLAQEEVREHNGFVSEANSLFGTQGPFRTTRKVYSYTGNSYGDPTKIIDKGDIALTTDDTTTTITHVANTTGTNPNDNEKYYVVSQVKEVKVFPGDNVTTGTPLQKERHYFDGITVFDATNVPTKGNVTKTEQWNNVTDTWIATTFGYDSYGNKTRTTDPLGRVTNTTYTDTATAAYPNTYPVKTCQVLSAAGVTPVVEHCTKTKWDLVLGLPLEVTDPNNAIAKSSYDKLGRKKTDTDPLNNIVSYDYLDWTDPWKRRIVRTLPDGSADGLWEATHLDGLGRTAQVVREGASADVTYNQVTQYKDASTQVWKQSLWYTNGATVRYTVTEYDALDRVLTLTHPDDNKVENRYLHDAGGKPYVKTIGEEGQETLTWKDAHDRVIKIQEKDGTATYTTTISYDNYDTQRNHKIETTDANSNVTSITLDSLGRKTKEVRAGGATWTYTYFADGQVETETDAKGQVTTHTYDALGRGKTQMVGGQTTTWYYDEGTNGIGRLTRVVFPGGSKEQTFDLAGRIATKKICIDTACKTLSTTYDALGRTKILTYPDSEAVTYGYNAAGNLSSVSGYVSAMTWNAAGQLLTMNYANGTINTYTYDDNRTWLKTADAKKGTTVLYTSSYGYDKSARVKSMTQGTPTAVTTTYTYDGLDRLKQIKNAAGTVIQSYTYDGIGNITHNSLVGDYTYGDAGHKHAVTAAGSNAYTYDANGSMLTGGGNTLTWDAEDRVASITRAGVTTSFAYDEDEQRIKKTTGSTVTRYFSDLVEQAGSTNIQYYYAGSILVAQKKIFSTSTYSNWYHSDRLGSVRVISNMDGNEGKEYDYQAFGATLSSFGATANERGYTGHVSDAESGLIYMRARYYDATLSRFISADSIIPDAHEPQALNRYSYVYNNPLNATDPTGHHPAVKMIEVTVKVIVKGAKGAPKAIKRVFEATKAGYRKARAFLRKIFSGKHQGAGRKAANDGRITNRGFITAGAVGGGLNGFMTDLANGGNIISALKSAGAGAALGAVFAGFPVGIAIKTGSIGATAVTNVLSSGFASSASYVASQLLNGRPIDNLRLGTSFIGGFASGTFGFGVATVIAGKPAILLGLTQAQAMAVVGSKAYLGTAFGYMNGRIQALPGHRAGPPCHAPMICN